MPAIHIHNLFWVGFFFHIRSIIDFLTKERVATHLLLTFKIPGFGTAQANSVFNQNCSLILMYLKTRKLTTEKGLLKLPTDTGFGKSEASFKAKTMIRLLVVF